MKTPATIIVFMFAAISTFGQPINVLQEKFEKYFIERDSFKLDSKFELKSEVCYNDPDIIDEEFCETLSFEIKDKSGFHKDAILDIEKDSLIISSDYYVYSPWIWGKERELSGKVKVISITKKEIVLDLDILVLVEKSVSYLYKGRIIFYKSKKKKGERF